MNHTPGPWAVVNGAVYTERGNIGIAKMQRDETATAPSERDANARLIAAAPEMLEALKDVDDAWTGNGDMATAIDAVLLAIAKATNQPADNQ